LSSLHNAFGIKSSTVTLIEPASEHGAAGVDELQEQTVNLLNFQPVESRTFKGQIAFNVLVDPVSSDRTEDRILRQLSDILGDPFPLPMIAALQGPVFYSHGYSVFVHLHEAPSVTAIQEKLNLENSGIEWSDGASPVTAVGTDRILAGRIRQDVNQPAAYSIWLAADNLRLAVANALQTAADIIMAPTVEM
jgi:aspartate-semialdehyde dehydrogenase